MKPQDAAAIDASSSPPPARQPYQKPQLQVYGDLAAITGAVAGSKSFDGSAHPNKHFTS
jgi:hypothetical protein